MTNTTDARASWYRLAKQQAKEPWQLEALAFTEHEGAHLARLEQHVKNVQFFTDRPKPEPDPVGAALEATEEIRAKNRDATARSRKKTGPKSRW